MSSEKSSIKAKLKAAIIIIIRYCITQPKLKRLRAKDISGKPANQQLLPI
jgi:hypothetical protein